MLIRMQEESMQDQGYIFSVTYLENFQIQQLAIMYCFEHTNHSIHLSFLFQILHKFFTNTFKLLL